LSKATIAVGVGYPDGRLGMCNLAFLELTGYTEEDLRTINWNEDLPPREWAERERQALDKLSRIKKSVTYEKEYIHKSGRRVQVELVTHAVFDSQGQISHYYTFIRDITERKQIEAAKQEYNDRLEREVAQRTSELRSAQERLIRQERLAALGQIAGSIAHELRNPLGVISNAVYFLNLIKSETDPRVQEYLGIIESETRTAEKIVSDLLDRSRIKSPERQPCSAADLIQQVLKRYPLPPNVGLTLDLPENLPELYIDPGQIVQVIGDLLTNAYQAMPDGGRLNLSARQVNQNQVSISIADTGVGIPEENLSKLFEPLFTTKKRGVGLGLTLSKSLAEANDGKIEVQSTPGGGANFTIYLPSVQKGTEGSLPEDHNAVQ
jgi:PAS domain S-box-containing protein